MDKVKIWILFILFSLVFLYSDNQAELFKQLNNKKLFFTQKADIFLQLTKYSEQKGVKDKLFKLLAQFAPELREEIIYRLFYEGGPLFREALFQKQLSPQIISILLSILDTNGSSRLFLPGN